MTRNDIEMVDTSPKLWCLCLIEGETTTLTSTVSASDTYIDMLKERIHKKFKLDIPTPRLTLWKVRYISISRDLFRHSSYG